jgi:hypothetical protein
MAHACISAGTRENRREDTKGVPARCIGKVLPDWPEENYWDVRCPEVRAALTKVSDHQGDQVSPGAAQCSNWCRGTSTPAFHVVSMLTWQ